MDTINALALESLSYGSARPARILFEELRRFKPSFEAMKVGFSVSRARVRMISGKQRRTPYFACRYNLGNLQDVNIVAFCYSLIADWNLLEADAEQYRRRIHSALREELIHGIQVLTVKKRYERSEDLKKRFYDAEAYYDYLLGQIIEELVQTEEGEKAVLTAAKLYYEDWTISSVEKLRETDRKCHGRDGYSVSEIIRQIIQIRFGELISEEAKGKAWDKHRLFFVGEYGTAENLMKAMAAKLRQAVPLLTRVSPTLVEALSEIEEGVQALADRTA